jgi:predicted Rossmann-fold nucleotide-binding protein
LGRDYITEEDFELLRVFDSPEDVTNAIVTWYTKQEVTGKKALQS